MKVLLLNPPALSMYSTFGLSLPPMGLLYIAASLEQAGHQVTVLDLTVEGVQLSDQELAAADVVGISSDTTRIERAFALARRAKAAGKLVVMGGPHPQFLADEILTAGNVDCIVKGEGEAVLPVLLKAIQSGEPFDTVAGILFRKAGHTIETASPEPLDVEQLPLPARHLLDLKPYQSMVNGRLAAPVITSRGCPGACHFCSSSSFFGRGWRARSAESVLAEIDELYNRYGYRAIAFMDDNFTLDPRRVEQIADGVIQRGYDLKWWNLSRVDSIVKNPVMVAKMAAAGSNTVYLGIESDNAETLNSLGKRSSTAEVEQAIRILKANGIETYGSYIIGNLNEEPADVKRTVDLAIRLDTDIAQFSILTPYPGTVLYEQVKDRIFTRKWKFYDGLHLVFRHPRINRHHLQYLLINAYIRFYRRSSRATEGFKEATGRVGLSFRKVALCAWELFV
jgi:anaerobic magnesium-protoporphyrin IX monomethyl ester cyclase